MATPVEKNVLLNHAPHCKHCQKPLTVRQQRTGFCCLGCTAAYDYISSMNLIGFYNLIDDKEILPAALANDNLIALFDDSEFQKGFCRESSDGSKREAQIYVGGITCYACVWLIDQVVAKKFSDVETNISLSQGLATITYDPKKRSLSDIVKMIRSLGFRVNPSLSDHTKDNLQELVRLGVATFCLMNVMLVSVPDYSDASILDDKIFWQLFRWMAVIFTTIVMTFGAAPFYRSAFSSAKQLKVNIDQSIVFAVLLTYLYSLWNTVQGTGPIYFDSVCAIITLLGWGRYLQRRVMQKAEQSIRGLTDYAMQYVRVQVQGKEIIAPISSIAIHTDYIVLPGDPVPFDSVVIQGESDVNYEQLTGESDPVGVAPGSQVRAGAVNLTSRLTLKTEQAGTESFLLKVNDIIGKILTQKSSYTNFSDRLGTAFFLLVLIVSAGIFYTNWSMSPEEAVARTIAALLIACPCAFAIAVPLTMARCAALGIRSGVVLKSQRAIEVLGRLQRVFFDKTGTLTTGSLEVSTASPLSSALACEKITQEEVIAVLSKIHQFSNHHAAYAVCNWANLRDKAATQAVSVSTEDLRQVKEIFGKGLVFTYKNREWRLGNAGFVGVDKANEQQNTAQEDLLLSIGGTLIFTFKFEDLLLPDAASTIEALKKRGIAVGMISGDSLKKASSLASILGIDPALVYAEQSPLQKVERLAKPGTQHLISAMIGNGFNDSMAMAKSDIGVSVTTANQQAKDSADVCLLMPGLSPLLYATELASVAKRKIYTAFSFAALYNALGLFLAAKGHMHPVVAAILMPISSLVVISIAMTWPKINPFAGENK